VVSRKREQQRTDNRSPQSPPSGSVCALISSCAGMRSQKGHEMSKRKIVETARIPLKDGNRAPALSIWCKIGKGCHALDPNRYHLKCLCCCRLQCERISTNSEQQQLQREGGGDSKRREGRGRRGARPRLQEGAQLRRPRSAGPRPREELAPSAPLAGHGRAKTTA